jgi:hypothetical protein
MEAKLERESKMAGNWGAIERPWGGVETTSCCLVLPNRRLKSFKIRADPG